MENKELSLKLNALKKVIKVNHDYSMGLYLHLQEIARDRDLNIWTFGEFINHLNWRDIDLYDVINNSEIDNDEPINYVCVKYDSRTKAPNFYFFDSESKTIDYVIEELEPHFVECIECFEEFGTCDDGFFNNDIAELFEN